MTNTKKRFMTSTRQTIETFPPDCNHIIDVRKVMRKLDIFYRVCSDLKLNCMQKLQYNRQGLLIN